MMGTQPRTPRVLRILSVCLLFAAAALLAACSDDDDPATSTNATLTFSATTGAAAAAVPGASRPLATLANGITVDAFRMGVGEIELEQDMNQEVESEVEFEGQFLVDILAGTVEDTATGGSAQQLVAVLPSGTYEELEFELEPLAEVDTGAPGTPTGLYIDGTDPGASRTFTIRILVPFKVEVEGPQAIVLDGQSNDLLVVFRLDQLFTPANLDSLIALFGVTPVVNHFDITVDGTATLAQLEGLETLFDNALEFGEDEDGDDDLSDDEDVDDDSA